MWSAVAAAASAATAFPVWEAANQHRPRLTGRQSIVKQRLDIFFAICGCSGAGNLSVMSKQ
jgi:hypothetical protein